MDRAYSFISVKSVDEERRTIRGIATTPEADRVGDVVEPRGAKFSLPIPLLWQHDKTQPIGTVTAARVTDKGIEVDAHVPAGISARLDEAWSLIKAGVVRGLSIGFRATEAEPMKSGGVRFKKWEWLELSAVTIPANAGASISLVKSLDHELLAASGELSNSPGVSGKQPLYLKPPKATMKTVSEQIKDLEATLTSKSARMEEVMKASVEQGRATEADEADEFDSLSNEVKRLNGDLARLRTLETMSVAKATVVSSVDNGRALEVRNGASLSVKSAQLPPGIPFARFVMCMAAARGNPESALNVAKAHYPDMPQIHNVIELAKSQGSSDFGSIMKAAVVAGTTTGSTFAAPLVDYANFTGDFLEFLRPQTIVGKFGANGVPGLRRVPFNVKIPGRTSGGTAAWVGEGAPKPLTAFDFSTSTLGWTKIAAISVLTEELIRFSSPSAETLVRDALAEAVIERMDLDFVNPAKAAVAGVSPASITNGASTVASAGGTEADIQADVTALMGLYIAANLTPSSGVWIMTATTALQLSLMKNALGNAAFPGVTMTGGTFVGLPVIVSQYVPAGVLILANASDIYLADDGQVVVDASREASLQMLSDPTNNSATGTATTMVSMFQTNSVAIRAERYVNWQRRRAAAVAYLTGVNYDGAAGA